MPQMTIFIPTFNRLASLRRALESVQAQTYKDLKILVCDNASEDHTYEMMQEMIQKDSRITYYRHPSNMGMLFNYVFGISKVETECFSILSDDDILLPSFCEISIEGLLKFPEAAFFASSCVIFSRQQGIVRVPLDLWPYEGQYDPVIGACEMVGKYPVPTTIAFRKSVLKEISIDLQNPIGWDCDFLLQIAHKFPIAISKEVTGIFFNHSGSLTSAMDAQNACDSIARIIQRAITFGWAESSRCVRMLRIDLTLLMMSRGYIVEGYQIAKRNLLHNFSCLSVWFFYFSTLLLKCIPGLYSYMGLARKMYRVFSGTKKEYPEYEKYVRELG